MLEFRLACHAHSYMVHRFSRHSGGATLREKPGSECCFGGAAVWALLLERTHPKLATDVIYVAGDRVVTDPLCKPFSMGRNLFCVHSKKRIDDQPELKAEKQRTNRRTVVEMTKALREVHCCKECPLSCSEEPSFTISQSAGVQYSA